MGDRLAVCAVVTVVSGFVFGRWDHPNRAVEASVVEPVDVFEGGELDVIEAPPWSEM